MLLRIIFCLIVLIIGHKIAYSQERPEENAIIQPTERKSNQYVGLQANLLIKSLLNFGGTTTSTANPYLLTYSVNSKKNGVGFATGIGLSSIQSRTTDNFVTVTSKTNDFAWRFGLDVKKYLSRRWLTGYGFDFLVEANKSETISSSGGSSNPTVTTKTNRQGFGPRVSLNYQFHERLMIGTEASYYFKWIDQKTTVTNGGNQPNNNASLQQFSFTLPAVVFLVMKF
ncbi:MAG TPA: hypothetical protein VF473_09605 [Cyclobacteriaceae bacterium]